MFNEFDCDKDGTINPKDMQQAFERMGQPTSEEEVEEILHDHNEKYHDGE
jgi:Ca2+-binding EF-hand superfamily protein